MHAHNFSNLGHTAVLKIGDTLGFSCYPLFRMTCKAKEQDFKKCIIDLSDTSKFEFAGLGMIMMLIDHMNKRNGSVELVNCPEDLHDFLTGLRTLHHLAIHKRPVTAAAPCTQRPAA